MGIREPGDSHKQIPPAAGGLQLYKPVPLESICGFCGNKMVKTDKSTVIEYRCEPCNFTRAFALSHQSPPEPKQPVMPKQSVIQNYLGTLSISHTPSNSRYIGIEAPLDSIVVDPLKKMRRGEFSPCCGEHLRTRWSPGNKDREWLVCVKCEKIYQLDK